MVALKAQQVILIAQDAATQAKEQAATAKTEVNTLHKHRDALQRAVEAPQAKMLVEREVYPKGAKRPCRGFKGGQLRRI